MPAVPVVSFAFMTFLISEFQVEHSFTLVLPPTERLTDSVSGLSQIIALVSRSDSVPIKSEGTRVLVNVVKSLWSSEWNNSAVSEEKKRRREQAIRAVLNPEYIFALAGLIGRSGRYPILVNEGVVALTLICTHGEGGKLDYLHSHSTIS